MKCSKEKKTENREMEEKKRGIVRESKRGEKQRQREREGEGEGKQGKMNTISPGKNQRRIQTNCPYRNRAISYL